MKILPLIQGTPEWLSARTHYFTASEAPIVMGASKYQSRADLLRQKHTGITPEVDGFKQALFDRGHAAEAAARLLVEEMIGEPLSPITATSDDDMLLASLDGATLMGDVLFECKLWNEDLAAQVRAGELEPHYYWQLEQELLVTGAEKVIFVTSDGTREKFMCMDYRAVPGRAEQLLAAWAQFAADLATFKPEPTAPAAPVGRAPETLPALRIEVQGMVTQSNLDAFKANALAVIGAINRTLETDEDFANAEATVKWCGDVEDRLKAAKQHALSQTESIDALFKTIDDISAEARKTRLELDKHVTARKASIKLEIVQEGKAAYDAHEAALRAECGAWIVLMSPDFAGAIKGLRTVASIRNAVHTTLANAKIKANESARMIRAALAALDEESKGYEHLFHDRLSFISKSAEDVRALVRGRISEHKAAEDRRAAELAERERARIRQEEVDRLAREQAEAEALRVKEAKAAAAAVLQSVALPPAPAAGNVAPMRAPVDDARMNITALNAKLAPVSIDSAGLHALGFDPVDQLKASKLYRASDFDRICAAIVDHINKVRQPLAA